jgi:2-(1,2-epoxy-1,2-dihydrophenyl)acetyl-CoA isomerase
MSDVVFDIADGVATLTLNRPDVLNSFNRSMARELREAFERVAADDALRAVVLTGAGRAFCAGQDLAEAAPKDGAMPDLGDIVRDGYNPLIRAIRKLEKPVLCAVNGVAAGAGANLAFACDIVFASSTATFIQSFAKIGVIPDSGGTFMLPRIVGLHRATIMTMLAEKMSAQQARDWGLVYVVTEPEALMETVVGTARHLATQPTRALGLIKRGFNASLGVDLETQNLTQELAHLPGSYAPPSGCLLLATARKEPVGCVALKRLSDAVCEMKRLYVRPAFRRLGIARGLVQRLMAEARERGCREMRLVTLKSFEGAEPLYASLGFNRMEPWRPTKMPLEHMVFMNPDAKDITPGRIGYVAIGKGLGIFEGDNGEFRPKDKATAVELAVAIYKGLGSIRNTGN